MTSPSNPNPGLIQLNFIKPPADPYPDKINFCTFVQTGENEVSKEVMLGGGIMDASFDEETGTITLKINVPAPDKVPQGFKWSQETTKVGDGQTLTRTMDLQKFRINQWREKQNSGGEPKPTTTATKTP